MSLFKHNVNGQQSPTVVQLLKKTTRQKTKKDTVKQQSSWPKATKKTVPTLLTQQEQHKQMYKTTLQQLNKLTN